MQQRHLLTGVPNILSVCAWQCGGSSEPSLWDVRPQPQRDPQHQPARLAALSVRPALHLPGRDGCTQGPLGDHPPIKPRSLPPTVGIILLNLSHLYSCCFCIGCQAKPPSSSVGVGKQLPLAPQLVGVQGPGQISDHL